MCAGWGKSAHSGLDFCTPLSTASSTSGISQDNFATPVDEGGTIIRANSALPGVYNFTARSLSQPDADDDNIENQLDTCPYVTNLGDPRVSCSGDMDNDGIDDACDPTPTETKVDEDDDAYTNRGDNCPLIANGAAPDNQIDSDGDGIGDSCDVNPSVPDGTIVDVTNTATVEIGGAPPTPPVTPTATPTGTPSPLLPNDDLNSATVISDLPFADSIDTRAATTASDDPSCAGRGRTVWYSFTPTEDMRIEVNTFGSNYDTTLSVYTGVRGALNQIACSDDTEGLQSQVAFNAMAGETYFFMVGAFGSGPGGDLMFSVIAVPPLEIGLRIDPDGSVVARTGVVTITGTVTCSKPAYLEVFGELRQRAGRVIIRSSFLDSLQCDGQASWSATVTGENGLFKAGRVEVSATA